MSRLVPVRESAMQVRRNRDGVEIDVPRRRSARRLLFPAWAVLVVGYGLVDMLRHPEQNDQGWPFLVVWCGFGLFLVCMGSWGALNRERLRVDGRALVQSRRLGPLRRERCFDRARVEDLRVSTASFSPVSPRASFAMLGMGAGAIAFDYGDRTIHVADTEEAEAKRIVAALREAGVDT